MHNEELGTGGVGVHSPCHRNDSPCMLDGVGNAVGEELALDLLLGAAHTCTLGVTALDHKALDNSVEDKPVIEALFYQLLKICDGYRRSIGIELYLYLFSVFHFNNDHWYYLLIISIYPLPWAACPGR